MLMLEIYYNKDDGAEYLIYLTNWTYMVLTGVAITDFIITAYVHLKRKDIIDGMYDIHLFGPRHGKTCLRGFRQSETQTSFLSYRD